MNRLEAVKEVLNRIHVSYGTGSVQEITVTSWSTLDGNSCYPKGTPLRGMVIARRTSYDAHAKEWNVYSHGLGKLRVHYFDKDRIARFDVEGCTS